MCCDDGTRKTSSYCPNLSGGGCYINNRGCIPGNKQMVSGLEAKAEFCCAPSGTTGSMDCPQGMRHCGLECRWEHVECCTGDECTSFFHRDECTPGGQYLCAWCPETRICASCAAGSCCAGDLCAGKGSCWKGDVCPKQGGSGKDGGSAVDKGTAGGGCTADGECPGTAICVSTRNCVKNVVGEGCDCAGSTDGTCADFVAKGIDVRACGTCSASYSACCAGWMCVNGRCQKSCP